MEDVLLKMGCKCSVRILVFKFYINCDQGSFYDELVVCSISDVAKIEWLDFKLPE